MRNRLASTLMALVMIATVTAGCFGDEPAPPPVLPEPAPVVLDIAPLNRTVHRADCTLYSQGYAAPAEPLRAFVPEGFQLAEGSRVPGTTNVAVYITSCPVIDEEVQPANASVLAMDTIEVIMAIPVSPPESERDENFTRNYVPLGITVQGTGLHARYVAWGFTAAEATNISHTNSNDGITFQSSVDWTDGTGSYMIQAAGQAGSSVTSQTAYRLWAVQDGQAVGSVIVENAQGQHVGTGAAVFTYEGGGPAPPVAVGTTSDGSGIESYTRHVTRGGAVPAPLLGAGNA